MPTMTARDPMVDPDDVEVDIYLPSTRSWKSITMLRQDAIVRAGVALIVMRYNSQSIEDVEILLLKRAGSHGAGTWSVPGGWMDFAEGSGEAALRECKEEAGLDAVYVKPAGVTEDFFATEGKHCVTLWHRGIVPPGSEPRRMEPDKVTEFRWVGPGGPFPMPLFLPLANYLAQGNTL
jgi:8-oxo-dGTP diphosphatase